MKTYNSNFLSFRRWASIFGGLLLVVFGGVYFFNVSAQTEDDKKPAAQNLVNGKVAFTRRLAGPTAPEGRIIIANSDGSGGVWLATPASEDITQPAWSPDGNSLAFTSRQQNQDLYVINANGSGLLNLTNTGFTTGEANPSWSATGKIAYEQTNSSGGNAQIWVINPDGTGKAQFSGITQPFPNAPAWSPDGSKLAFVSGTEIWVINANGTNEQRVTNNSTTDTDPAWSPDGTKIVFKKGNDIAIINADGTNETIVTDGSAPAWSPDGTKIAFSRSGTGNGVFTMDVNGTNQVRIATNTTNFPLCCDTIYENPAWQPFAQTPNTYNISGRVTYNNLPVGGATVNLSGTTTATTTTDAVGNYQFSGLTIGGNYTVTPSVPNYLFTPASRTFNALNSNQTGNFEVQGVCVNGNRCVRNGKVAFVYNSDIYTINPDGTNQVNITNHTASDGEPNFSPFGSSIIFTTNRNGNSEIYRMNTDGTNPVNLTNNPSAEISPFYSPDGSTIVFASFRDGNYEIYKMNADGSNQVRLTNEPTSDIYPAFSPDGQKIIFISRRAGGSEKVFSMNADGTNQQLLSEAAGFAPGYNRPTYSPDGSKIIFGFSSDTGTTHPSVWTMNSDGTNRTQLGLGRFPSYSPDGTKTLSICCYFEPNLDPARLRVSGQILSQNQLNYDYSPPAWQTIPLTRRTPFDYDGDGRSDVSVFRASENKWYLLQSSTLSLRESIFAVAGDIPVPADYDGDGKTDLAIFRPSTGSWWFLSSINNAQVNVTFGQAGDIPRPSDFDGDGKTDYVLYRPSNSVWYRYGSTGITSVLAFGVAEDKPLVGDFDGDGKSDPAVFRPSTGDWWYRSSINGQFVTLHWGAAGDIAVPGDYDGDGKTDFVVFRPTDGGWYILYSTGSYTIATFGTVGDKPIAADYDGDGKTDIAVWRPSTGTWYLLQTTSGFGAVNFGVSSDIPTENAFIQ